MSMHLTKKSMIKKTIQVGGATLLSRILAIGREVLQVKFFGVGAVSDAFIAAFRFPNLFRHVFAEGALNASFVPVYVKATAQHEKADANGLMTATFLFVQGFILLLYAIILAFPGLVVGIIAPGFSPEQVAYTSKFLKLLFPFLAFVSGSALFGGALNAVNYFFIPAVGPALWNCIYVLTLAVCIWFDAAATYLCLGVLLGGIVQFVLNVAAYFRHGRSLGAVTPVSKNLFRQVIAKFVPCLFGVSIVEINLLVSGMVASFLPHGSVSLLYYGSRFMNLPLGVFGVALANILLPHFSRIVLYAPKRFNFYLLEVAKLVTWVILPVSLLFMFCAQDLFSMIFAFSKKVGPAQVVQAQWILIVYCSGLVFFSFNKIMLSLFYSLKDTKHATIVSAFGAGLNVAANGVSLYLYSIYGIASAAVISGVGMSFIGCYFLYRYHGIRFYGQQYLHFLQRFALQLAGVCGLFLLLYAAGMQCAPYIAVTSTVLRTLGYWAFLGLVSGGSFLAMLRSRRLFGVRLRLLDSGHRGARRTSTAGLETVGRSRDEKVSDQQL